MNKSKLKLIVSRWLILLSALVLAFAILLFRMREIIYSYAKAKAENILINASNNAVLNVFNKNDIKYDRLSHVFRDDTGAVCDIEIDTSLVNVLKSQIANEMFSLTDRDKYSVKIPIGTLINNEFTSGYGPSVKITLSIAHTANVHFKSVLKPAGINNFLHQIVIVSDIDCSVLSFGASRSFSFQNEVIAAQSVISGRVPESYTSVYETDPTQFADDVFNFSQ